MGSLFPLLPPREGDLRQLATRLNEPGFHISRRQSILGPLKAPTRPRRAEAYTSTGVNYLSGFATRARVLKKAIIPSEKVT